MMKSNLHTHTCFCDGVNTVEEMTKAAIEKGYGVLGFTGHAPLDGEGYCMSKEGMLAYFEEIRRVKKAYASRIEILSGLEIDYFSEIPPVPMDVVVGSVHYVRGEGEFLYSVDDTPRVLEKAIQTFANGDERLFIQKFYDTTIKNAKRLYACKLQRPKTTCVIGHFDLIKKFNAGNRYFDEDSGWYQTMAAEAAEKCCFPGLAVEINHGGIFRGYRKDPYPSGFLLDIFKEKGMEIITTRDAHSTDAL